jgi:hypothetical protein
MYDYRLIALLLVLWMQPGVKTYESQHRINTPRTWQDINNSLDPTAASNWLLSSIKRYNSESRGPSTPPPSKPAVVFSLNEGDDKITLLDEF